MDIIVIGKMPFYKHEVITISNESLKNVVVFIIILIIQKIHYLSGHLISVLSIKMNFPEKQVKTIQYWKLMARDITLGTVISGSFTWSILVWRRRCKSLYRRGSKTIYCRFHRDRRLFFNGLGLKPGLVSYFGCTPI